MICANDRDLIARLTHPRGGYKKTYEVEVSGRCDNAALATLRGEMTIDGYLLRPVGVRVLRKAGFHTILEFTLHEGRNRQIRKMCAMAGLNVVRLEHTAIANLTIDDLTPCQWRKLTTSKTAEHKRP